MPKPIELPQSWARGHRTNTCQADRRAGGVGEMRPGGPGAGGLEGEEGFSRRVGGDRTPGRRIAHARADWRAGRRVARDAVGQVTGFVGHQAQCLDWYWELWGA